MADAGIAKWETFRHARKELRPCGLSWIAGKGKSFTSYRWNGVSPIIGDSPKTGVSDLREQGTNVNNNKRGSPRARRAQGPTLNVWGLWVDVWRKQYGKQRPDPSPGGANVKAAKEIGKLLGGDKAKVQEVFRRWIADEDPWIAKQGHALKVLVSRLDGYRLEGKKNGPQASTRAFAGAEQDRGKFRNVKKTVIGG